MIVVLTGERGVGKTTVCEKLARLASGRGKRVGGILSPAVYETEGMQAGIDLVDIASGKRRRLATTVDKLEGPRVGRFSMDDEVINWGLDCLLTAIRKQFDLIIVDEIGPLELVGQRGLAPALPALRQRESPPGRNQIPLSTPSTSPLLGQSGNRPTNGDVGATVIVVRPELLDELLSQLGNPSAIIQKITPDNREALPAELAELMWGSSVPEAADDLRR